MGDFLQFMLWFVVGWISMGIMLDTQTEARRAARIAAENSKRPLDY